MRGMVVVAAFWLALGGSAWLLWYYPLVFAGALSGVLVVRISIGIYRHEMGLNLMQPSLFDQPSPESLRYQRGSRTSKAAAVKAAEFALEQRARVRTWLIACGDNGGSQKECHEQIGIERHSLTFRFRELEQLGVVRKTAHVRAGCTVYSATKETT